MRKWGCLCLVLWVCLPFARAMSAQAAIVLEAQTGAVCYAHNADAQLSMASTTKIMTALVALEATENLDRTYTVQPEYVAVEGSSMYLKAGERMTVQDTLYGLLLRSGNDAAMALAGECGGLDTFVQAMNDKAVSLGLYHTHFDNPSGLDGQTHYTTARELAQLTAYALQNEEFRQIVATKTYQYAAGEMTNHNKLLWQYEGAIGVKTGYTLHSGRCLVSAATRNGRTYICVTLSDPNDWADHAALLDAAFAQLEQTTIHTTSQPMDSVSVQGGTAVAVPVATATALEGWLTAEEQTQLHTEVCLPNFVYAPITAGQPLGEVSYTLNGVEIAREPLVATQTIAQLPPRLSWWEKIVQKIRNWWFT